MLALLCRNLWRCPPSEDSCVLPKVDVNSHWETLHRRRSWRHQARSIHCQVRTRCQWHGLDDWTTTTEQCLTPATETIYTTPGGFEDFSSRYVAWLSTNAFDVVDIHFISSHLPHFSHSSSSSSSSSTVHNSFSFFTIGWKLSFSTGLPP